MSTIAISRPTERGNSWFSLRALSNETAKGLALLRRRQATVLMATATTGLMYLMIQFAIGGGHINHTVLAATLPALGAYAMASTAALAGAGGIAEEINGGTLEQTHLSPARPSLLALGRVGALGAEGLLPAIVLAALFWAGFGVPYTLRLDVLVPLVLTVADALAYALLMTALVLRVASVGAVVHVFNMAVGFFAGMYVPVTIFPHGILIFARFLPTTLGVEVLHTTLTGESLSAAWSDATLPWLLIHVAVLSGLGWATYLATLRRARREGGLSPR